MPRPAGLFCAHTPVLTVALHGHLSAEFGLAGGAKATARLLHTVGCKVLPRDLTLATHQGRPNAINGLGLKTEATDPVQTKPQLDLVHTNPNILAANPELINPEHLLAPLRIGYWAWELETFPEGWETFFNDYDEIWCPSTFTAQALSQRSPIPVVAVPHLPDWARLDALRLQRNQRQDNACVGQPPFRFLSLFDFWSTAERKNPLGAIQAFQRAFPVDQAGQRPVELLIKTSSASQFPDACQTLMEQCGADPRIVWQHQHLTAAELDQLLLSADVLLSPHRSEGFGLVLADAMAIELPVIATGYSGNLEFMPPGSAELLPWKPQTIHKTCGDYRQGLYWAEPDPECTAQAMQRCVQHPQALAAMAKTGAEAVRERLSAERLSAIVRQRLGTLLLHPSRRELRAGLPTAQQALA